MKLFKYEVEKMKELAKTQDTLETYNLYNFERNGTSICRNLYRAETIMEVARRYFSTLVLIRKCNES